MSEFRNNLYLGLCMTGFIVLALGGLAIEIATDRFAAKIVGLDSIPYITMPLGAGLIFVSVISWPTSRGISGTGFAAGVGYWLIAISTL